MQQAYEKLGQFYLGKTFDLSTRTLRDELVLYDSKDLTTHAVIIGMTGSGKTGLGIGLIEEALIDGVPVIAIDPKGDIPNLLLTFPDLSAERLLPWVNPQEAAEKGLTLEAYAAQQAEVWKSGLQRWHQNLDRIRRLREGAEMVIYTPGSQAGVPVSLLHSLAPPPAAVLEDGDLLREQLEGTTRSLLSLVGLEGNPTRDREFVLVANILKQAWLKGKSLTLADLIRAVQKPPFQQVGVFDLESFYPGEDRLRLALQLNNLLAAPGFEAWTRGVPLNIPRFLYTPAGKPKASIFTISHLSEHERMFFVSTLLNALVSWMRAQPGTSSLRALLYVDEVFGYLPPVQNPPSKKPLLTLLKQARASGLGVVLSTQNPVDLDYKALSNAGTWFIGRLQTERDKERVLEGLEGAATGGSFDRNRAGQILAGLSKRTFYLHNVHEMKPSIFQTRWVLSYLSGPMTREQIRKLMSPVRAELVSRQSPPPLKPPETGATQPGSPTPTPPGIPVFFVPPNKTAATPSYIPALIGYARIRYSNVRYNVDLARELFLAFPLQEGPVPVDWDGALHLTSAPEALSSKPLPGAQFSRLPPAASRKASYTKWRRAFVRYVAQNHALLLLQAPKLKVFSAPGESETEFRARLAQRCRELRDTEVEKLRARYASRFQTLHDRLLRAEQAVQREREQASAATVQTVVSFGTALLGAFLGRRRVNTTAASRLGTAMSRASRTKKQKMDVVRAQERVASIRERLEVLQQELEQKIAVLSSKYDPQTVQVREVRIRPRISDVTLDLFGQGWLPFAATPNGGLEPAFDTDPD